MLSYACSKSNHQLAIVSYIQALESICGQQAQADDDRVLVRLQAILVLVRIHARL